MAVSTKPSTNGKAKKAIDAAALLKSAAKGGKTAKSSPFDFDGNLEQAAASVLTLEQKISELEREKQLARDEVRRTLDPWYRQRIAKYGHESSVRVPAGKVGTLRVTYQHRYLKLPADQAEHVETVIGDDGIYARFFAPAASVKIRKEITDDPERLNDVVVKLAEALGAETFAEIFESEQTIYPTKVFTERRYVDLTDEQNAELELAGVRQVVAMAEHKGK